MNLDVPLGYLSPPKNEERERGPHALCNCEPLTQAAACALVSRRFFTRSLVHYTQCHFFTAVHVLSQQQERSSSIDSCLCSCLLHLNRDMFFLSPSQWTVHSVYCVCIVSLLHCRKTKSVRKKCTNVNFLHSLHVRKQKYKRMKIREHQPAATSEKPGAKRTLTCICYAWVTLSLCTFCLSLPPFSLVPPRTRTIAMFDVFEWSISGQNKLKFNRWHAFWRVIFYPPSARAVKDLRWTQPMNLVIRQASKKWMHVFYSV